MENKKGDVPFYLVAILIAVAITGITFVAMVFMKGSANSIIDRVKNLFQGG